VCGGSSISYEGEFNGLVWELIRIGSHFVDCGVFGFGFGCEDPGGGFGL
jgi:hypothetical protein